MFENRAVLESVVLASELSNSIGLVGQALGDDDRDVIVLLAGTEAADFVHDGR